MRGHFVVVLTALLTLAVAAPAQAASVSIVDFGFSPDTVRVAQGTTVTWSNTGSFTHTSTQDDPLALWDTGNILPGDMAGATIAAAGTYAYHCSIHPSRMHGQVKVPLIADQTTGTTATTFMLTLASEAQTGYVYDVQKKRNNGRWRSWMSAVTDTSAMFQARRPGTYRFRSRLHRSSDGETSDWSPKKRIVVS